METFMNKLFTYNKQKIANNYYYIFASILFA